MKINHNRKIYAADNDYEHSEDSAYEGDNSLEDALYDMQDSIEDMQDQVDEIQEDDVDIEIDNNIEGHYIAECDRCKGIFISAVTDSDQKITKISGICPLCEKETDQYLNWVINKRDR